MPDPATTNKRARPRRPTRMPSPHPWSCALPCAPRRVAEAGGPARRSRRRPSTLPSPRAPSAVHASSFFPSKRPGSGGPIRAEANTGSRAIVCSRTNRFTGAAQRRWMMSEHMCAPRPVQPLVGRRPRPPSVPTLARRPKVSVRAARKAAARIATPCSEPSTFACAPPHHATRLQRRPSSSSCPAHALPGYGRGTWVTH